MSGRGGFSTWFYGFLAGGVIGVAACAAAAIYITNAPIPFVNKVDQASDKINPIADGTIPDPNKPLLGGADSGAKTKVTEVQAGTPSKEQSAAETQLQMAQGSRFVVQAGAFRSEAEADGRRAELGLLGFESRVIPRTDETGTLYRVRLGPFGTVKEANDVRAQLESNSIRAIVGRIK